LGSDGPPSLSAWVVTGRLSALTMPVVTVPASPRGLPTAMTGSPTPILSESPIAMGVRSLGASVMVMTARSVEGSVPRTSASKVRPSARVTVSFWAPETTWLLVSTCVLSMMTPDPWPPPWAVVAVMLTTLGDTAEAVAVQSGAVALPCLTGAPAVLPSCVADEGLAVLEVASGQ
jgi:hypothetical protein